MYYPTTRVLTLLQLLQSHPGMNGAEIARRLDVDIRTARRYVVMLEDLGVPITTQRGRFGGYRLSPGFKLPPLMFNDEEALALTLSLLSARRLGLGPVSGVEGALAKVERVLPEPIRQRVRAIEETLTWDLGAEPGRRADSDVVWALTTAAWERREVLLRYHGLSGDETERRFAPYGLVCRRAHWYVIGYCHLRGGQRLFRLDRVLSVAVGQTTFERPPEFDTLAAVLTSLGSVPRGFALEVVLDTTLERARQVIAADIATIEALPDRGVLMRGYTDDIDWIARVLAGLGCRLEIRRPPELRAALRRHAERLAAWAEE